MNDKTFISRWSRLKSEKAAQARTSEDAPDTATQTSTLATGDIIEAYPDAPLGEFSTPDSENDSALTESSEPTESSELTDSSELTETSELPETPALTDEDMPALESLSEQSDFSQFFSSGVSDELRNLALRKLFNLPQFNIRDGLNDYDDDFSKIPVLAKEVAAKVLDWLHENQNPLTSGLEKEPSAEQIQEPSAELAQEPSAGLIQEPSAELAQEPAIAASDLTEKHISDFHEDVREPYANSKHFIEAEDDLGDADLHG
ncbi:DUF3306 domain-containing protein [Neptunomonas antarctica]|uniref:DUF3306 domain-containing protein n=1 Tax=Neptunomonas antarctica TaxID=619304 RepID=A0A1N7ND87_9GAMM|nr:DUF3306 domain-containing protein [Neptunomonas antarctica]SIS96159.1 Protein of unknown function [Neptunomonas antarctica]